MYVFMLTVILRFSFKYERQKALKILYLCEIEGEAIMNIEKSINSGWLIREKETEDLGMNQKVLQENNVNCDS